MVAELSSINIIGIYGNSQRGILQTRDKIFIYDQSWCGSESISEVNTRRNDMTLGSHVMAQLTAHSHRRELR